MKSTQYSRMDEEDPCPSRNRICCITIFSSVLLLALSIAGVFYWKMAGFAAAKTTVIVSDGSPEQVYPPPPPHIEYARVARYLVHISDWASLATESSHATIEGYPFANVFSISDGTKHNSSGTPYFYFTSMGLSVHDLQKNPRASLTASLAQSNYCAVHDLDPQDPLCAHIILTGEVVKIVAGSAEENYARNALFSRHPEMELWPEDHDWFFARLAIRHIYLLDYFGAFKVVAPEAYFAATPN